MCCCSWVHALGDPLDRATLAGGIPSLEDDDDLLAGLDHPVLQLYQLGLEIEQGLEVGMTRRLFVIGADCGTLGNGRQLSVLSFGFPPVSSPSARALVAPQAAPMRACLSPIKWHAGRSCGVMSRIRPKTRLRSLADSVYS